MLSLDRRMLLQHALLVVGAGAMPGIPEALAAAASSRRQLDAPRYKLLVALADTIIPQTDTPGAVEAGVPPLVDALLGNWAAPARRAAILGALDKIDVLARGKHRRSFAELSPEDRQTLLIPHDAEALKPAPRPPAPAIPVGAAPTTVDPNYGKAKQEPVQAPSLFSGPTFADPGYGKLKEVIVVLYYFSESALTHELPYEHAPGEWLPSIPVTPASRSWGGASAI